MAYVKQTWTDGVSPLNAERMNHIESGIKGLSDESAELKSATEGNAAAITLLYGEVWKKLDYSAFNIPVLELTGDADGMSKDNKVTLSTKMLNYYRKRTLIGKTYYSDWEKTQPAGTTTMQYCARPAGGTTCEFNIGKTIYYISSADCTEWFEIDGNVTCKWQGSTSLYFPKKNYTIEFGSPVEVCGGWGEHSKYCLKANWVDASNIRNILGARIWGKMVNEREGAAARLKALPNGGAIDGFPIWVNLNGEPLGLYTMNIPKDQWMFGMTGENTNEAIVCAEHFTFQSAAKCDGTDLEIEYSASDDTTSVVTSLNNLISAVQNVEGEDDLAAVEALIDINSVIDYYILTVCLAHYDGIQKNYILSTYDGTKWFMSAYDMDACFGNKIDGEGIGWATSDPYFSDLGDQHLLFGLVKAFYADRIKARFAVLHDWILSEIDIQHEAYKLTHDFPAVLINEDNRLWPTRPGTATNNLNQISEFMRLRFQKLEYNIGTI